MGDFSRFQLFHKSCYKCKKISSFTPILIGTQRNRQGHQTKITDSGSGRFLAPIQWGTLKVRFIRAANIDGSRAEEKIHHVLACCLHSYLLPWKPTSWSYASGPWLSRIYVHRSRKTFCVGTSNSRNYLTPSRPRLSASWHTMLTNSKAAVLLPQQSNQAADSAHRKPRKFQGVSVSFKELPNSSG